MKKTYWIRTADGGKPSSSLTLVIVTWAVIMLWLITSIFAPMFGLTMLTFNASEAMLVLSPILLNYYGRRHTDAKSDEAQMKHTGTPKKVMTQINQHPDVHPDDIGGEAD